MMMKMKMLLLAGSVLCVCLQALTARAQSANDQQAARRPYVSELTVYTDLRTGREFRVLRDPATGNFTSSTGEPLSYYVSTVSRDTFYGPGGLWVNEALNYTTDAGYTVDYDRLRRRDAGYQPAVPATPAGDKVKATESELKVKSARGDRKIKETGDELKMKSNDGAEKVKVTEDEYKAKSDEGGNKVKQTDDELKVKSADGGKAKINANETKIKDGEGGKIKSNGRETKIKTEDTKVKAKGDKILIKPR